MIEFFRVELYYPGKMGGTAFECAPEMSLEDLEPLKDLIRSDGFRVNYEARGDNMSLIVYKEGEVPERIVTPGYQKTFLGMDGTHVAVYHPGRLRKHGVRWFE